MLRFFRFIASVIPWTDPAPLAVQPTETGPTEPGTAAEEPEDIDSPFSSSEESREEEEEEEEEEQTFVVASVLWIDPKRPREPSSGEDEEKPVPVPEEPPTKVQALEAPDGFVTLPLPSVVSSLPRIVALDLDPMDKNVRKCLFSFWFAASS